MFTFTRLKRKIKVIKITIAKFIRSFKHGMWSAKSRKSPQDILIIKVVKSLLERSDCRVFYSPLSSKIYVHTKDKKIIVIFDAYSINITNHRFFFTSNLKEGMSDEITQIAKERIENEMLGIERIVSSNQKNFLIDVYEHTSKQKVRSIKKSVDEYNSDRIFSEFESI